MLFHCLVYNEVFQWEKYIDSHIFYADGDFNATSQTGIVPDQISLPIINDSEAELIEGFIALLQLQRSLIDPRDISRIQFLNDIILVSINDDG